MKLYEFKAKAMAKLIVYQPKGKKEKEFVDSVIAKLHTLRAMNMPDLLLTLHFALNDVEISSELKSIIKEIIKLAAEVVSAQD